MKRILMALLIGCVVTSCTSQETRLATDQDVHVVDRLVASLGTRKVWASNTVKIWLANPVVIVTCRSPTGKPTVLHAWPKSQNDFHVPMIRVNSGDKLYQISDEEYGQLEKLNERVPNHTSDGIRQPADGSPKPSK